MVEHPIQQPIREIDVYLSEEGCTVFTVGKNDVTRIEACTKSGMHADIPYIRVWADETCLAEFCQHNIVGVYFAPAEVATQPTPDDIVRWKKKGIANVVNGTCTTCEKPEADCWCVPF